MQEGGAAARQAGDEHRGGDRFVQDLRRGAFRLAQAQQVGQEAQRVPTRGHASDHAQIGLGHAGLDEGLQRREEIAATEIVVAGAAAGRLDHLVRRKAAPENSKTRRHRVHHPKRRPDHRHLSPPARAVRQIVTSAAHPVSASSRSRKSSP
jgi:hypothetical protein